MVVSCKSNPTKVTYEALKNGFVSPPDSIQTSIYWYWISDNITEEGVKKDLYSMKKAGINRAFIGNIGLHEAPSGKVKMFSEEWWRIIHTALKTATELNIEIGIFNSPGWSQSGGPWVKPYEAMRFLTTSEIRVKGPCRISVKLDRPGEHFQDLRTIAWPVPKDDQEFLNSKNSTITSIPAIKGLSKLTDGNAQTGIRFPAGKEFKIFFTAKSKWKVRSLSIQVIEFPVVCRVQLQIRENDGVYRTLKDFEINRSNASLGVGFKPYAPVVISIPATTSSDFCLVFSQYEPGGGLAETILATSPKVERFSEKTLAKMYQAPLPGWSEYLWSQQPKVDDKATLIDAQKVVDISQYMVGDSLIGWDVPAGTWTILRSGMTPTRTVNGPATPEATGFEIDKMNKKLVEKHFDAFIGKLLRRIPESDRKCFKVVVQDSYETGGQNMTDNFPEEFSQRYGYDLVPYLPVFDGKVVNSEMESDRFLWDLRRLVADKVAHDYVGGFREICRKHGLSTWLENYGHWGFPSEFLLYGGQSDEVSGEFWDGREYGNIENRAATSCAHIYGKTKVSAESFTCAGGAFRRYPALLKQRCDRFFAEGINNTLLHVFISQPYEDKNPGLNTWFGTEFNRKNTWFSQMDLFTLYLKRTNFMLQQGLNVADIAYFIGEDTPKMTGIQYPVLPVGYQFDYMNADVIENSMTVKDGLITLSHGVKYRILVLPELETMRPEVLARIRQLVYDGATVLGPPPKRSPSQQNQPEADRQVQAMASDLWGNIDGVKIKMRPVGKGRVIYGHDLKASLKLINCLPDCQLPEDNSIHFGHRTLGNTEIYFLSNQSETTKIFTPEFRISGKHPELWQAVNGSTRNLPFFIRKEFTTKVPIQLEPSESAFVVFDSPAGRPTGDDSKNFPEPYVLTCLNGPWYVRFDSIQRGPDEPVVFNTLQDWSESKDERIKYYSGTAEYTYDFIIRKLPENEQIEMDLGQVNAMAKVTVNGTYAGGVWTRPYVLDITGLAHEGVNTVKIEVVNTWVNRLIGDSKLSEDKRPTWCPENPYKPDSPLKPAGLKGPVRILSRKY